MPAFLFSGENKLRANNVAQSSIATGADTSFPLGASWNGCRTFNDFFGLNHFFEYVIRNDNGEMEKGLGYLIDSTTLFRHAVLDNHLGTATLVNFGTGTKIVMCSADAGEGIVPIIRGDAPVVSLHSVAAPSATLALAANRPRLSAFWLNRPFQCTQIGCRVTTAVAGSNVRLAVYQLTTASASGYTFKLLDDVGTVDSTTTGEKNLTYTRKLGSGVYFTAAISNTNPALQAYPGGTGEVGLSILNGTSTGSHFDYGSALAGSNAIAPLTMLIANPSANSTSPRIHFKGAYL